VITLGHIPTSERTIRVASFTIRNGQIPKLHARPKLDECPAFFN